MCIIYVPRSTLKKSFKAIFGKYIIITVEQTRTNKKKTKELDDEPQILYTPLWSQTHWAKKSLLELNDQIHLRCLPTCHIFRIGIM